MYSLLYGVLFWRTIAAEYETESYILARTSRYTLSTWLCGFPITCNHYVNKWCTIPYNGKLARQKTFTNSPLEVHSRENIRGLQRYSTKPSFKTKDVREMEKFR